MFWSQLKVLRRHGVQYIKDLDAATLPAVFRGRPVLTPGIPAARAAEVAALCPTGAIGYEGGLSLDMGRCLFCGECAHVAPQHIRFTSDYRIGSNLRGALVVRETASREPSAGAVRQIPFDAAAVRPEIPKLFSQALKLRQVSAGGDNSTEMELNASMNVNFDFPRYGVEFVASPRHADGVVVTGPVTENMARALELTFEAVPQPRVLIVAGADAISGGLFAGSRAVDRSFFERHTPDLYLPGAPVHPLTFIDGVRTLLARK